MPYTDKQRRAVFSEITRRKKGGAPKMFKGMDENEMETYAKEPLEKEIKRKKKRVY